MGTLHPRTQPWPARPLQRRAGSPFLWDWWLCRALQRWGRVRRGRRTQPSGLLAPFFQPGSWFLGACGCRAGGRGSAQGQREPRSSLRAHSPALLTASLFLPSLHWHISKCRVPVISVGPHLWWRLRFKASEKSGVKKRKKKTTHPKPGESKFPAKIAKFAHQI